MSKSGCVSAGTIRISYTNDDKYRRNSNPSAAACTTRSSTACNTITQNKSNQLRRCCSCDVKQAGKAKAKNAPRKYSGPSKQSKARPKVMTKEEYEEYQKCIQQISKEEQDAALAAANEKRERLMKESMQRKEEFRKLDMSKTREKDPWLNEIEEEARRRTSYILERAQNMRLEQEQEIQKCNRLILETKCRAIRDAQVAEKKLIEHELTEEEKRLNDMMENERRWAIKEEMKREQEEIARRQQFANVLKDQIAENEEQRLIGFERKQEESRLINLSNIAWQQNEIAKMRNKEAGNAKIRQELAEGNEQLKHLKAMEEEENRIINYRIQEYQRLKAERDAQIAEERRLEKLRKEQDRARLAAQAKQTQELQGHLDEINAARVQEQVEREWRQKEREEALKRAKAQEILIKEREEQIRNKRIMQAIELERDKRDFERIVRIQKEAFCREKEELEKRRKQALIHRSEILKQVNEKERVRIQSRQKMFEEGLAIRTEAEMHKKKLRDAMERKCQEMKNNKVPEIYINEVKRMIESIQ